MPSGTLVTAYDVFANGQTQGQLSTAFSGVALDTDFYQNLYGFTLASDVTANLGSNAVKRTITLNWTSAAVALLPSNAAGISAFQTWMKTKFESALVSPVMAETAVSTLVLP